MPNYTVNASILTQFAQWIATTPPLFIGDEIIVQKLPFTHTDNLQINDYRGNSRLGFIYQHLCQELFTHCSPLAIEQTELQLNNEGRTLGELDFILRDPFSLDASHLAQHWEVAIKFYLLHQGRWYGPNAKDRLDKKLRHMLNHQLKHTHTPCFIEQYPQWQYLSQHLLMQGRLYINPFESHPIPRFCEGKEINVSQITGYWCYQKQFSQIDESLYQLDKSCWAIGAALTPELTAVTKPLQSILHCQSQSGRFWFIVPDNWPNNT
ncbi:DUF1853 family protein [Vibrio ezurae]|uniref:DUF1853 family protein n=1 Tax=Vibrio ezurae NBRC 102218 TaxID=1219080 RepID=U3AEA4_9VIBR|nr:DUF1853 family protein [Vibrio ezurae]GAD78251.1 hypothetical protein VEZ01S_01_00300 [Vibrio ezurae NBRC 102218]